MKWVMLMLLSVMAPIASAQVAPSLNACIAEGISYGVQKTRSVGRTAVEASLKCYGQTAKELYDEVQFYGRQNDSVDDRNRRRIVRHFGLANSQCIWTYETADGRPANEFTCFIDLDLHTDAIGAM